jgi:hypothetical protein
VVANVVAGVKRQHLPPIIANLAAAATPCAINLVTHHDDDLAGTQRERRRALAIVAVNTIKRSL